MRAIPTKRQAHPLACPPSPKSQQAPPHGCHIGAQRMPADSSDDGFSPSSSGAGFSVLSTQLHGRPVMSLVCLSALAMVEYRRVLSACLGCSYFSLYDTQWKTRSAYFLPLVPDPGCAALVTPLFPPPPSQEDSSQQLTLPLPIHVPAPTETPTTSATTPAAPVLQPTPEQRQQQQVQVPPLDYHPFDATTRQGERSYCRRTTIDTRMAQTAITAYS